MSDRARVASRITTGSNIHEFFDKATHERVLVLTDLVFIDDFLGIGALTVPAAGSAANGDAWVAKIVDSAGAPTVAGVASAAGGQMQLALDSTSEKQDAALYWGDQK